MGQVTGRAFISVNGVRYASKPGATLRMGGESRSPVIGDEGPVGFQETPNNPRIECTFIDNEAFDIEAVNAFKNGSVTFETDTGAVYIQRDSWRSEDPLTLNAQTGEVPAVFEGLSLEKA